MTWRMRDAAAGERFQTVAEAGWRSQTERQSELSTLLPLWPSQISDASPEGHRRVVFKLRHALCAERRRGLAGHWSYDLARHAAILRAYRKECAALTRKQASGEGPHQPVQAPAPSGTCPRE